jgi:hypothetical protein
MTVPFDITAYHAAQNKLERDPSSLTEADLAQLRRLMDETELRAKLDAAKAPLRYKHAPGSTAPPPSGPLTEEELGAIIGTAIVKAVRPLVTRVKMLEQEVARLRGEPPASTPVRAVR